MPASLETKYPRLSLRRQAWWRLRMPLVDHSLNTKRFGGEGYRASGAKRTMATALAPAERMFVGVPVGSGSVNRGDDLCPGCEYDRSIDTEVIWEEIERLIKEVDASSAAWLALLIGG